MEHYRERLRRLLYIDDLNPGMPTRVEISVKGSNSAASVYVSKAFIQFLLDKTGPEKTLPEKEKVTQESSLKLKNENQSKGGKARAEKLSPERRADIATKAANTRWSKTPSSRIYKIIHKHMHVPFEEISDDKSLVDNLGMNSLDSVELIMDIEEEFDIEITDEEAETIVTVGDIERFLLSKDVKINKPAIVKG